MKARAMKMSDPRTVLVLAGLMFVPIQATFGQGDAGGTDKSERQVLTEYLEAFKLKKWPQVEEIYEKTIEAYFPQLKKDSSINLRYCKALYNQGKRKYSKAAEKLNDLLKQDQRSIEAFYTLAKIRAQSRKPEEQEEAKDHLISATRLGLPGIRELTSPANKKIFTPLLNQPQFVLRLMRAGQEFQVDEVNNIFDLPYDPGPPDGKGDGDGGKIVPPDDEAKERIAELEKKVDTLFKDIEGLLERAEVDGLLEKFRELNGLIEEFKQYNSTEVVEGKLQKWGERRKEFEDIRLALLLQLNVKEGNDILKGMAEALRKEEFAKVFEGFEAMNRLVDKMRTNENQEAFQRNAEALFFRAKKLNDEAVKLKRIKELALIVTGIVLDPEKRKEEKDPNKEYGNRAIINDKVYREGEPLTDEFDTPIADLHVVAILEGAVRFRYQGTIFVRELTPPPE